MKSIKTSALMIAVFVMAGCQQTGPKETFGGLGGAVLGGVLGSQVGGGKGKLIATGAGAVLGLLVGSNIGKSLDDVDKLKMERTAQHHLETQPDRQVSEWENPNSNNRGAIKVNRTYRDNNGQNCREFEQTIYIDGQEELATGTACRQSDGTWQIQG